MWPLKQAIAQYILGHPILEVPHISSARVPKMTRHRASGQAVVRLNYRDHYLGPWGSRAARVAYDRLIAEWLAAGRQGAPVARIQKMPLSIRRGSAGRRPVVAVRSGNSGSINAHCSSVSSCRRIRADLRVVSCPDHSYDQHCFEFSDRA